MINQSLTRRDNFQSNAMSSLFPYALTEGFIIILVDETIVGLVDGVGYYVCVAANVEYG